MRKIAILSAAVAGAALAAPAHAAIILGPTDGSLGTFVDTDTNRQWLRLDNFFNQGPDQMAATAATAGFTVASLSDVQGLLNSLPLTGGSGWSDYAAIMGSGPNRDLIWGASQSAATGYYDWAFAYSGATDWSYYYAAQDGSTVPNGGTEQADLNLWAFRSFTQVSAVPEPSTWAMMLVGFGGVGFAMRRAKKAEAKLAIA